MKRRTHETGVRRASIIIYALARQSISIIVIIIIAGAEPEVLSQNKTFAQKIYYHNI